MISIIAALAENRAIGYKGQLLCHISEDLRRFKQLTQNNVVIMGRKTYDSLPFKPLKNRINIVITSKDIELDGCIVVHSTNEALERAVEYDKEIFIIGGAKIYKQFMDKADKLYLTHIEEKYEADTFFPPIGKEWKVVNIQHGEGNNYIFADYIREDV